MRHSKIQWKEIPLPSGAAVTLSRILAEARVIPENPGFITGHFDLTRHLAVSPRLFFKKIRPSGSGFEYHDLICELFCSRLASRLSLPVPACIPLEVPGVGFGLLSSLVGKQTMTSVAQEAIVNADRLSAMFVFEQLMLNVDDKPDHFRVRELPDGKYEFFVVDHGHTLHAWRAELQDPATLDSSPTLLLPSSPQNEYRILNYGQLVANVRDLGARVVESTPPVLSEVFHELQESQMGDPGLQRAFAERPKHETIISKIIQIRAKALDQIVRLKCQQANIRIDPEQTFVSMVGVGASQ